MHNVTTSRHIRSATELVILVPLKKDFVPITDLVMTYATRVTTVLKALSEIRQQKVELGFGEPVGPIELLQTIYRVQWTVLEPFDDAQFQDGAVARQLRSPQVMLTSHFDSSWEDYFRDLVKIGGPLLDLIFSHCQGYEGNSCRDGYEAFSDFIRRHQRPCNFLYATAPEVTIDDIRYYTRLASAVSNGAGAINSAAIRPVKVDSIESFQMPAVHDEQTRSSWRSIHALYDIRRRLFTDAIGLVTREKPFSDLALYENAIRSVLEFEPEVIRLRSVVEAQLGAATAPPPKTELLSAVLWVRELLPETPSLPQARPLDAARPRTWQQKNLPQAQTLFESIQGNILSGYGDDRVGSYVVGNGRALFVQCKDGSALQALLRKVKDSITTEAVSRAEREGARINLAITYSGFKLLGLPETELEKFPREFREGMEERSGLLGDVAQNHPQSWRLPIRSDGVERIHLSMVHVMLIVVGPDRANVNRAVSQWELESDDDWDIVHQLELSPTDQRERSQPVPPEQYQRRGAHAPSPLDVLPLGEFLLGYEDRLGGISAYADPREGDPSVKLFKDGAFLAVRKMQQNNRELERYIDVVERRVRDVAVVDPKVPATVLRAEVTALIVGRKPDGGMLGRLQPPSTLDPNEFDFADDPQGELCPLHSHVRRSNPRGNLDIVDTPRIVRRGLAYQRETVGPEKEEEGLLFMAYCANLAQQYELVQRYVNGGNSTGLSSLQNDLLCGAPVRDPIPRLVSLAGTSAQPRAGGPTTIELPPRNEPFVTLRWGLYLFVPSRAAVDWIVQYETPATESDARSADRGEARIAEIDALPFPERLHEWKRLLEEVPEADSVQARRAADVAAAITKAGGAHLVRESRDPKNVGSAFVVVTSEALAETVLGDDEVFSVKEYGERLQSSLSDHYLGVDVGDPPNPQGLTYADRSTKANAELVKISARAETEAFVEATKILNAPGELELDPDGRSPDGTSRSTVSVRDLASAVVARLCSSWLDMPGIAGATNDRALIESMDRFLVASRRCFQAFPAAHLVKVAEENKQAIDHDYRGRTYPKLAGAITESSLQDSHVLGGTFSSDRSRRPRGPHEQFELQDFLKMVSLGAVGFGPPAIGAITRILDQWIESDELWQIQRSSRRGEDLRAKIYEAMRKTPAPPTLYRTAKKATKLVNGKLVVDVPAGARVIVNLAAVYADSVRRKQTDKPEAWFFGGQHGGAQRTGGHPPHGCPGRDAGILVIEGVVRALLVRRSLRRERRFLVSYEKEVLCVPPSHSAVSS